MKSLTAAGLLFLIAVYSIQAGQPGYQDLKRQAEAYYSEASYSKAHELYEQAAAFPLAPDDSRWVAFRLGDTEWRAEASTNNSDQSKSDDARSRLESVISAFKRPEDRDLTWAQAQESLGDFWWTRPNLQNWNQAWPAYQQVLDWWASSKDIDNARNRYLGIIWKISEPRQDYPYYYYGYSYAPLDTIENAVKIALSGKDKAHAHFLLALRLRNEGGIPERRRVPAEFEAALVPGKATKSYDKALYFYGEWLASQGPMVQDSNHQWQQQPDYAKALDMFRKLVASYSKGESKFWDQANEQIKSITTSSVGLGVGNVYLPGSEIQFGLSWRNVRNINLALYRVDLTQDINFGQNDAVTGAWIQRIATAGKEKIKSWSKETTDKGDYKPGYENITMDQKLPTGAYLLEATTPTFASARDVILVSDAGIITKTSKSHAVVYVCNALDGSPLAGADVKIWWVNYKNGTHTIHDLNGRTNQDGIANFAITSDSGYTPELFATAKTADRQAFSSSYSRYYNPNAQSWRIYAYTDRPAYRPGETVQWKFVARKYDGEIYSTPANQTLKLRIVDPHQSVVKEAQATMNQFGSAWGSLDLGESLPLGEYRIVFEDAQSQSIIGNATLFRLEEYKLPEFKVAVQTPEENGRKKTFRVGDKVDVNIQADYYFGGPVANASVEVLVYQNPFYKYWTRPHEYSWYYEEPGYQQNYGARNGQVIKHETLTTDATGKAVLIFDTPQGNQGDFQYTIEARVTDASRREVIAEDSVKVTNQSYYVYPEAKHYIYHPQDSVGVDIKAVDANDKGVQVEGKLSVTRDYWYEIWLDPSGREVKDDELKQLRARSKTFPPAPARPDQKPWQLKFNGYLHEDISSQTLKTDAEGNAEFSFKPEKEGYYRVAWASADKDALPITAETAVWVATGNTTDLGYRYGGLQILADKDTFRAGQTAPVMLVAPESDRYVLFSTEANDIYSCQLVHLTGNVKVINLPVTEKDVPNIFLTAFMVQGGIVFADSKQVIVPPVDQFISVDIKPDRQEYRPRDEATLTVTTSDAAGKPVPAEVSLGMVDASVFYIQQDYAGDPRKFYYGEKRQELVQTLSSFQLRSYVELVRSEKAEGGFEVLQKVHDLQNAPSAGPGVAGGRPVSSTGPMGIGGFAQAEYGVVTKSSIVAREMVETDRKDDTLVMNGRAVLDAEKAPPIGAPAEMPAAPPPNPEPGAPAVRVRHDFRSTAIWRPDVVTDENGRATVKVKMPESLTTWTSTARAVTADNKVGIGNSEARTNEPMVVRLEGPRFFVAGDIATVSAVINNNTDSAIHAGAILGAEGLVVTGASSGGANLKPDAQAPVDVPPHGEARVDWTVRVDGPGLPKLKVAARSENYSDAMERTFIAYEHGLDKFVSRSGKVRGNGVAVTLDLPAARKKESTTMSVQISPSMAVTLLDSLPYLIDYPYGCTEQTMSRFLPAAITTKALKDLGLKPEDVAGRIFGGVEAATASQTHPGGAKDLAKLESMTSQSLSRLYGFQHEDGGWGWWKEDDSDHFMTAYVVWGLSLARDAGIAVEDARLEKAVKYLDDELVKEESNYDQQAWMVHALAVYHSSVKDSKVTTFQSKAFDNLWANRANLNAYTRALLALAAHSYGYSDKARVLVNNLENGVVIDRAPDRSVIQIGPASATASVIPTAHWGEDGVYWRWSEGGVEATAFALRALLAIDPKNKLVEPTANWLIKNRRGAQWNNTRDTAICVLSLDDYLIQTGELQPDSEYELSVNGQTIADKKLTAADALAAPARFDIPAESARDGANEIRISRKEGSSAIYFAASVRYFSLEEPVTSAGNEIFARRDYYKLTPRPTLLKGDVYERRPLRDGDTVTSGDRIETVITVESKNNYEYLMFEDLKPAGFEAVGVQSDTPLYAREVRSDGINRKFGEGGDQPQTASTRTHAVVSAGIETDNGAAPDQATSQDTTGRTVSVHQELRDRKVALFIDKLPQGVWDIRYDLRAEVPGAFHALPVTGGAMYVPEIRCNGTEVRVRVVDKK